MFLVTNLRLKNWRNFRAVDVRLRPRTFVVGPNASGKSNLLDALRFVRDLASPGWGLQRAVKERGGFAALRSLFTHGPGSQIEIELEATSDSVVWTYEVHLSAAKQVPLVKLERVTRDGKQVERRDASAEARLEERSQTWLEQSGRNARFEPLVLGLRGIAYAHLVPQFLRTARLTGDAAYESYGSRFIDRVVSTPERARKRRLKQINTALEGVVPFFSKLDATKDKLGVPHLELRLEHWRTQGAWQDEQQLSDGTLRLIALLWEAQEAGPPLLLEEPEISLHEAVVKQLPALIAEVATHRQVVMTTHAFTMFNGRGIDPHEVLLVSPGHGQQAKESVVQTGAENPNIVLAVKHQLALGKELEAATTAPDPTQLLLALQ